MVLERSGSRLFGVTPFANDTIKLALDGLGSGGEPAVRLTFAAGGEIQPSKPGQTRYWRWEAMLPALPSGGSLNLTISSARGAAAGCAPQVITDVTVGQVFLCSGQVRTRAPDLPSAHGADD